MKLPRRKFLQLTAGAAALPAVSRGAWSQTYPMRPVRVFVAAAAGGVNDILARLVGQWLSERLGQPFLIDNRPGAGGVVADRGYFNGEEILACEEAGITVTLPKPMTSNSKAEGRFGKQDFRYVAEENVYICPAGERLAYHYTNEENGLVLHRYWTNACQSCTIKHSCTTAKERRITRWEHEHILEAVQRRLDEHPEKMRQRRETVEHPFGTIKARMGSTHFLMKTLPRVAAEMALHVLAYNLTRVINIMGVQPVLAAMRA
jgi:Transposase DDE domain